MRPAGAARTTKDNSQKHPYVRQQWVEGKRFGRPKQRYVYDNGHSWSGSGEGRWEKVNA